MRMSLIVFLLSILGVEMHIVLSKTLKEDLKRIKDVIINDFHFCFTYPELADKVGYSVVTVKRRMKMLCSLYKVKNKTDLLLELQAEKLA